MKKIFWTTIFWLVIVLGFTFYMKSFNANMANGFASRLGATSVASQDTLSTGEDTTGDVMSGINAIQTMLSDMQDTLNGLAGTSTTATPVVEQKPTTTTPTTTTTTTTAE